VNFNFAAPPHRRTAAPPHRRTAAPPHRRTDCADLLSFFWDYGAIAAWSMP